MALLVVIQFSPGLQKAVIILNQTTREMFEIPSEKQVLRERQQKMLSFHSIRRKTHLFSFML